MAKPKIIIFDFDGTIADTLETILQIFNRLAPIFHYRPIDLADVETLRDKSSEDILKFLEISILKIPFLVRRARSSLEKAMTSVRPVAGIPEVIASLKTRGYRLGILTSNSTSNAQKFLANHGLTGFEFVYSTGLGGKRKVLRHILRKHNLSSDGVVYIGDETRDIDAARQNGIAVIAVTWGLNSKSILAKHRPNLIVDLPRNLPAKISQV